MRIDLVDQRRERAWRPPASWLRALERLAAPAGAPEWRATLVLVDTERMTALNARWRGKDEPTDVLSFSYLEESGEGAPVLPAGERQAARDLWRAAADAAAADAAAADGGAAIGEIVLAPAFIAAECAREGRAEDEELALLTVHGLLHLLGWTHDAAADRRAMRRQETELLAAAGFRHPLAQGEDPD